MAARAGPTGGHHYCSSRSCRDVRRHEYFGPTRFPEDMIIRVNVEATPTTISRTVVVSLCRQTPPAPSRRCIYSKTMPCLGRSLTRPCFYPLGASGQMKGGAYVPLVPHGAIFFGRLDGRTENLFYHHALPATLFPPTLALIRCLQFCMLRVFTPRTDNIIQVIHIIHIIQII